MTQPLDVLILAVSRVKKGVALAGMSTEPHPVTGRVWIDLVREDGPLQLRDITLANGVLIQPGDVIRCEGLEPMPEPPHTEQYVLTDASKLSFLRHITPERYAKFLPDHLDKDPQAVIERHERSLCLVHATELHAMFERDDKRLKSYMLFELPDMDSFDEMPVTDLAWRALGQQWMKSEDTDELAFDHEDMREKFGEVYLVLGLYRANSLIIRGVHTLPAYSAKINPQHL